MWRSASSLDRIARTCLALVFATNGVWAASIVGFDSVGTPGSLHSIDPQTGAVTAISDGAGIAMSSGPTAHTLLYSSGVNTYELNVKTGRRRVYACLSDPCSTVGDHAFDPQTGNLYALGTLYPLGDEYPNPVTALFRLIDSGVPMLGVPDSTEISYSLIGLLGVNEINVIEYVSGIGLLGTDGYSALYRVDSNNGQASLLTPLFIVLPDMGGVTPMNGLAWDPDSRQLLGSAPFGTGVGGIGLPRLYTIVIDESSPAFGSATLLNESPPGLTGIATVTPVPEPTSLELVVVGIGLFFGLRCRPRVLR